MVPVEQLVAVGVGHRHDEHGQARRRVVVARGRQCAGVAGGEPQHGQGLAAQGGVDRLALHAVLERDVPPRLRVDEVERVEVVVGGDADCGFERAVWLDEVIAYLDGLSIHVGTPHTPWEDTDPSWALRTSSRGPPSATRAQIEGVRISSQERGGGLGGVRTGGRRMTHRSRRAHPVRPGV